MTAPGYNESVTRLFPDTHPEVEAVLIRLLRDAPTWRKLEMVGQMNAAVQTMMRSGLKECYPKDSPQMIQRRMADLLLGEDLALKVFGPPLEKDHAG
jgi:hypothetical protein